MNTGNTGHSAQSPHEEQRKQPCCSQFAHIAYRGISDGRLYVAYDRKWQELKYFKPHGLKAFCSDCRRRVY